MEEHQINEMLKESFNSIKELSNINTIIGAAFEKDNKTIIPVSKVTVGFIAGGSDMKKNMEKSTIYPFGGGVGGTVSIKPIAFLVFDKEKVEVLHLEQQTHILEKILDKIPNFYEKKENSSENDNIYEE